MKNNQGKQKKDKNNFITPILILVILSFVLWVWYEMSDMWFERLLVVYVGLIVLIPTTLGLLATLSHLLFPSIPIEKREANNIIARDKERRVERKKRNQSNGKKPKSTKVNPSPLYMPCRDVVVACSQNNLLTRQDILTLKSEIDYRLGTHRFIYDKNFNFENDFNEIYVKLKSSVLNNDDYEYLMRVINNIVERNTKGAI